ncbi:hypothetical protein [Streptomyces fumanus]|uniref:Uncharacterized protein n=1 Tax=Streptomyces fumanus TaxID=67302 RepID=A0A919AC19_9ACTN|nr:hypothetical protein [Streptomyces fumanus]GHE94431.1 hypothetical protein GCM10018772_18090 [Streptomyces fumanus]
MDRPHRPDLDRPLPRHLPPERTGRLRIPARFSTALGYDAVGLPHEHGERALACLPRAGCVFGDDLRWWWIVPAGSHIGVVWPPSSAYAVGGRLTDPSWTRTHRPHPAADRPRLIHAPRTGSPYTPPIPLYFLTCRLAGSAPRWTPDPVG